MILGTPFISLLYLSLVTEQEIESYVLGKENPIKFEFIRPPKIKELNLLQNASIKKINLIDRKQNQIKLLNKEIQYKRIEEQIKTPRIQKIRKDFEIKIEKEICETNPIAFHYRKIHEVALPYEDGFNETNIPTKARPIQMNEEYLKYCKQEIQDI